MYSASSVEMHGSFATLDDNSKRKSVLIRENPWLRSYSLFGFGLAGSE